MDYTTQLIYNLDVFIDQMYDKYGQHFILDELNNVLIHYIKKIYLT